MKNTLPKVGKPEAVREELLARVRANLAAMTDEEDEAITRAAEADPDNPPNRPPKRMGRPPAALTKEVVTIRLDRDVVEYFKASGAGWQTRVNDALRKAAALK
jgi:uncharacterized protein (DUF4415 family)